MPLGPGKYDAECTLVRERTFAAITMVVVIGGVRGTGFSVQTEGVEDALFLAETLESVARQLRNSVVQ